MNKNILKSLFVISCLFNTYFEIHGMLPAVQNFAEQAKKAIEDDLREHRFNSYTANTAFIFIAAAAAKRGTDCSKFGAFGFGLWLRGLIGSSIHINKISAPAQRLNRNTVIISDGSTLFIQPSLQNVANLGFLAIGGACMWNSSQDPISLTTSLATVAATVETGRFLCTGNFNWSVPMAQLGVSAIGIGLCNKLNIPAIVSQYIPSHLPTKINITFS